jgi:hypothetical protein
LLNYYGLTELANYKLDRRKQWSVSIGATQAFQHYTEGQSLPLIWTGFVGLTYVTSRMFL